MRTIVPPNVVYMPNNEKIKKYLNSFIPNENKVIRIYQREILFANDFGNARFRGHTVTNH